MRSILRMFLVIGLAVAEKLDRTYLPPPGAHLAGGTFDHLPLPNFQAVPKTLNENENNTNTAEGNLDEMDIRQTTLPEFHYNNNFLSTSTPMHSAETTPISQYSTSYMTMSTNLPTTIDFLNINRMPNQMYVYTPSKKPHSTENYNNQPALDTTGTRRENINRNQPTQFQPPSKYSQTPADEVTKTFIPSIPRKDLMNSKSKMSSSDKLNGYIKERTFPERSQAQNDRNAITLDYKNVYIPGGFSYNFDTSNNIHVEATGKDDKGMKAKGSYSYVGDDGKLYEVEYTADENGFQAKGSHLPTPPPVPEAIKKVIEQARRNKDGGSFDDGSYDERKYGYKKYMPRYNYRKNPKIVAEKKVTEEVKPSANKNGETNLHNYEETFGPIFEAEIGYNHGPTPSYKDNFGRLQESSISTIPSDMMTTVTTKVYTPVDEEDQTTGIEPTNRENDEKNIFKDVTTHSIQTTAIYTNGPTTENIIYKGEDFSRPRNYQNFDHRTGYYY